DFGVLLSREGHRFVDRISRPRLAKRRPEGRDHQEKKDSGTTAHPSYLRPEGWLYQLNSHNGSSGRPAGPAGAEKSTPEIASPSICSIMADLAPGSPPRDRG